MIVISLVLPLLTAGAALAKWSGIVSLSQKQSKKKGGEVGLQSFPQARRQKSTSTRVESL